VNNGFIDLKGMIGEEKFTTRGSVYGNKILTIIYPIQKRR